MSIRRRLNRHGADAVARMLTRSAKLEQLAARRVDARRLEIALTSLVRGGKRIQTVYDIGAHRGEWTRAVRRVLPEAEFVLFEGNPRHAETLRSLTRRVVIAVLADEEREVEWVATGEPGDSYRRELTAAYAGVAAERVRTSTLEGVVERDRLPLPDLIKADVQGSELDVLAGGRRAVAHAAAVLLECPIVPYNEGAPTIDAYFAAMDSVGFTVADFVHTHRHAGRATHVDVLFSRVES